MADEAETRSAGVVKLAAVGDLLLAVDPLGRFPARDARETFAPLRPLFDGCDIVFGNLECTLIGDGGTVATEPRVVSVPELVRGLPLAGFNLVTLANNHMFDCLAGGFRRLRSLLDESGVRWFGAGTDLRAATAPAIMEVNGLRIAFLAGVDDRSGPSAVAAEGSPGVAPLGVRALARQIAALKPQVDHVICSLHWGEERFLIPAPEQIAQAHALVDAGASVILGHHPHVLQGLEVYRGAPIIYSLGNFIACDVAYTSGDRLRWNRTERVGCVLRLRLDRDSVEVIDQIATCDDGRSVGPDRSGIGARRIRRANRCIRKGVTLKRYRREYLWVKTIRPTLAHLRWSKLKRLRARNVINAFRLLANARRAR